MNDLKSNTQEDSLLPINHYSIRLPIFQGPLDLLLFLIKKNEIDIYDIPIENVTRQYLTILNDMEKVDLELTGEFFVMTATLMLIKSRMILPKHEQSSTEEATEEEDPRWELVQQLIEYKKLKEQAEELGILVAQANDLIPREVYKEIVDHKKIKIKNTNSMEIWNTFNKILQRLAEKIVVGEINEEQISITDQMNYVLKIITNHREFLFSTLFEEKEVSINRLLSTFLAILELTRLNKLYLKQTENFGDILCTAR